MKRPVIQVLGLLAGAAAAAVGAQAPRPEAAMLSAARTFLAALEPAQREKAVFPFSSDERLNWHYVPFDRKGLPLKAMSAGQREAALKLLSASLSEPGAIKAARIRELESVLKELEKGSGPVRDPEGYFFSIFGEPSETGTWGWRYEGHHCSQNWTIVKGEATASSPQFFGANPAEVMDGPLKGRRVLAAEEDLARAFMNSLTEEQKKLAIISPTAPADIATSQDRKAAIQEDKGLPASQMSPEQKGILRQLGREYLGAQPEAIARKRAEAIQAGGVDAIKFAWMGPVEKGQKQYYRIQGPTFLIEFDNTTGNHIHSVWRDFKGDFGMDLLAMHYRAFPHNRYLAAVK